MLKIKSNFFFNITICAYIDVVRDNYFIYYSVIFKKFQIKKKETDLMRYFSHMFLFTSDLISFHNKKLKSTHCSCTEKNPFKIFWFIFTDHDLQTPKRSFKCDLYIYGWIPQSYFEAAV